MRADSKSSTDFRGGAGVTYHIADIRVNTSDISFCCSRLVDGVPNTRFTYNEANLVLVVRVNGERWRHLHFADSRTTTWPWTRVVIHKLEPGEYYDIEVNFVLEEKEPQRHQRTPGPQEPVSAHKACSLLPNRQISLRPSPADDLELGSTDKARICFSPTLSPDSRTQGSSKMTGGKESGGSQRGGIVYLDQSQSKDLQQPMTMLLPFLPATTSDLAASALVQNTHRATTELSATTDHLNTPDKDGKADSFEYKRLREECRELMLKRADLSTALEERKASWERSRTRESIKVSIASLRVAFQKDQPADARRKAQVLQRNESNRLLKEGLHKLETEISNLEVQSTTIEDALRVAESQYHLHSSAYLEEVTLREASVDENTKRIRDLENQIASTLSKKEKLLEKVLKQKDESIPELQMRLTDLREKIQLAETPPKQPAVTYDPEHGFGLSEDENDDRSPPMWTLAALDEAIGNQQDVIATLVSNF